MKKLFFVSTVSFVLFAGGIVSSQDLEFSDKAAIPSWANVSIETLVEKGIINGNADGTFRPNENVNRAEFCKILVLATGVPIYNSIEPSFPDVEAEDWFFSFVETAKHQGWITGYPDGTFDPGGDINRAEVAKVLVKAFSIETTELRTDQKWYEHYVRALEKEALLPHEISFGNFEASVLPNRSEIVEQVYRLMVYAGKISSFVEEKKEVKANANQNETYTAEVLAPLESKVYANAGDLYLSRKKGVNQKIYVYNKEEDVDVLHLTLNAKNNDVKVSEFQFRRIGSGKFADFSKAWLELEGNIVSNKVLIQEDLVHIELFQEFTIPKNKTKELVLKVDLSGQGKKGTSSRFVLYLPEWIASNTAKKIGFFPFGGEDLEIKN